MSDARETLEWAASLNELNNGGTKIATVGDAIREVLAEQGLIEDEIPETFYRGLETRHRVAQLVRIWQNAMEAHQKLEAENERLRAEKQRRVYYQDVVYAVCNHLDAFNGRTTVCGTVDEPSNDVQMGVAGLLYAHSLLEVERDRLAALTCGCGDSQKEMVCVDCQMTDMRAVESKAEARIEAALEKLAHQTQRRLEAEAWYTEERDRIAATLTKLREKREVCSHRPFPTLGPKDLDTILLDIVRSLS